ncbi:MAG: hypothetical protein MJK18_06320, partial [Bdellovibrionales bacterium]|nr:hypothetical protein [Bdellovibrionales bacterium]
LSEVQSFRIFEEKKPLEAPALLSKDKTIFIPNNDYPKNLYRANKETTSEYLIKNELVETEFSWQGKNGDAHYECALNKNILKDCENKKIVIPKIEPQKTYSFKVRAHRGDEVGQWSESVTYSYELEPAKSLSPIKFEEFWDGYSKKGNAYIKWTPLLFAHGYEVFISQRKDFKGAKSFLTRKPKYPFMIYYNKDYYWKVRAIDKKYRPISEFSEVFDLSLV